VACAAILALAQITTSGMRGRVTDPSSAVVPEARVTVTQVNTGYSRAMGTDAGGDYIFTELPVGPYNLVVEKVGFKKYTQSGIFLTVNQVAGINVTLSVGEVTQSMEVSTSSVIVNTQTTEVAPS